MIVVVLACRMPSPTEGANVLKCACGNSVSPGGQGVGFEGGGGYTRGNRADVETLASAEDQVGGQ